MGAPPPERTGCALSRSPSLYPFPPPSSSVVLPLFFPPHKLFIIIIIIRAVGNSPVLLLPIRNAAPPAPSAACATEALVASAGSCSGMSRRAGVSRTGGCGGRVFCRRNHSSGKFCRGARHLRRRLLTLSHAAVWPNRNDAPLRTLTPSRKMLGSVRPLPCPGLRSPTGK